MKIFEEFLVELFRKDYLSSPQLASKFDYQMKKIIDIIKEFGFKRTYYSDTSIKFANSQGIVIDIMPNEIYNTNIDTKKVVGYISEIEIGSGSWSMDNMVFINRLKKKYQYDKLFDKTVGKSELHFIEELYKNQLEWIKNNIKKYALLGEAQISKMSPKSLELMLTSICSNSSSKKVITNFFRNNQKIDRNAIKELKDIVDTAPDMDGVLEAMDLIINVFVNSNGGL